MDGFDLTPLAGLGSIRAAVEPGLAAPAIESLFDHLPGVLFFTKDETLRYSSASCAMVDLCGARHRDKVIGRAASDFFADSVAQRYEAADRRVISTGRAYTNQLDYCVRLRGRPVWLLLSRWPIFAGARAVGVVTIARCLDASAQRQATYARLASALSYLHANIATFEYHECADRAGISLSQLQRDFLQLFGVSPRAYLNKARLNCALELLAGSRPVVEIALACGYADQTAFTRWFRGATGASPIQYRRARMMRSQSAERSGAKHTVCADSSTLCAAGRQDHRHS
jgi:transcriptional regulator GlxA family with amidase domain